MEENDHEIGQRLLLGNAIAKTLHGEHGRARLAVGSAAKLVLADRKEGYLDPVLFGIPRAIRLGDVASAAHVVDLHVVQKLQRRVDRRLAQIAQMVVGQNRTVNARLAKEGRILDLAAQIRTALNNILANPLVAKHAL